MLGVVLATTEIQQAAQGNGQHEEVDQQEVERKHPARAAHMVFVHVLHHHDLKLPWQHQRGAQGQHHQPHPARPGIGPALLGMQQVRELWPRPRLGKNVAQTTKQAVDDKHADAQKSGQLDQRLKGYGRHHAFVALGGIEVARAKHDGETGQGDGDVKGAVLAPVQVRWSHRAAGREQCIARGHGLELQCNVGNDAHHGHQRHQRGEQLAFAIAAGDEVGNRGDAVRLGNANHLAQHRPAQHHGQRGPQVDGQEPHATCGRALDAAKVGPGGAVHRHRQRVHPGPGDD